MFSFLKRRFNVEDILNDDELFVFKRTAEFLKEQLSSAPFDPCLVSPSPFVFGYIHALADNCKVKFFEGRGGLVLLEPLCHETGLTRVAPAIKFYIEPKPYGSGAFPARDLEEHFNQGYRAGDSDFIVQQIHALGGHTDVADNNLIKYLSYEEMSFDGMGMGDYDINVHEKMEARIEELKVLKHRFNDDTPIDAGAI